MKDIKEDNENGINQSQHLKPAASEDFKDLKLSAQTKSGKLKFTTSKALGEIDLEEFPAD